MLQNAGELKRYPDKNVRCCVLLAYSLAITDRILLGRIVKDKYLLLYFYENFYEHDRKI